MSSELVAGATAGGPVPGAPLPKQPGAMSRFWKMLRQAGGVQLGMLGSGAILVLLFSVLAIFAPWIAPYGFNDNTADGKAFPVQSPPSAEHWFGRVRYHRKERQDQA